jgi:uncharacterized protein YdeI (YjbR/CyaY-like superfamily)
MSGRCKRSPLADGYGEQMVAHNDKPLLYFTSQEEWHDWLARNGGDSAGVRLQLVKKSSKLPGISYAQALDEALCFGWIDGQAGSIDDNFFLNSFTPRRPRSVWSQRNRDHIARLEAEERMKPAGIAQVEAAKADGRWDAAYRVSTMPVPAELQEALDANPKAAAFFAALNSQNRVAILFRLNGLKRAETRTRRISEFVAMLERGETPYPQKRAPQTRSSSPVAPEPGE